MRRPFAIALAAATVLLGGPVAVRAWAQPQGGAGEAQDRAPPSAPGEAKGDRGATTAPVTASPTAGAGEDGARPTAIGPGIRVVVKEKRLEVDCAFEIVDSAYFLEYLAVTPQGKVHEALLRLACTPDKLHLGLILIGLEAPAEPSVHYQGEPVEPAGPRVSLSVEYTDAASGKPIRRPIEEMIDDARTGGPLEPCGFAFTGSRFIARKARPATPPAKEPPPVFAASASGSAIALYHDPDAVLDLASISGGDVPLLVPTLGLVEIAGGVAGDERFRPSAHVPKHGTPAVLHVEVRK